MVLAFLLGVGLALAREQYKQKTTMWQLFEITARVGFDRFFAANHAILPVKFLEAGQDLGSGYGFLPLYAP